jgi:hypothetical protein
VAEVEVGECVEDDGCGVWRVGNGAVGECILACFTEIDLVEINENIPGELGEPFLIALVVALGGAELTRVIGDLIKRWMKHQENMEKIRTMKFYIEENFEQKEIKLEDLKILSQ